jgi:hypothetical protein
MHITRRDALARMAALGAAAFIRPRALGAATVKPFDHPDPRPGITSEHVLSEEKLGKRSKTVYADYAYAREYPEIFDGIFCTCRCNKSMGHRSLLSCFESDQPTGCMGCQEVAEFVGKRAKDGKSLAEIRKAVDEEYG